MTPPAERFKTDDAGSYDALAERFDVLSERYTGFVAERLAAEASRARPRRVLDLGCGSGLLTRRLNSEQVVAADLSAGMLARAAAGGGTALARMDAEALGFRAESFDAVVSLFALLHFPDPGACLSECRRVLRRGGRLHVGFGCGPRLFSRGALGRILDEARARLGARMRPPLRGPNLLDEIVEELTGPREAETTQLAERAGPDRRREAAQLVADAGFTHVRQQWVGRYAAIDDVDEFWNLQAVFSSFSRKRLAAAAPDVAAAVRERFYRRCTQETALGAKMVYPVGAMIVSARKP